MQTLQQRIEASNKRHAAAFAFYVNEAGMTHTAAWEKIAASTALAGQALRALADLCVATATNARKAA